MNIPGEMMGDGELHETSVAIGRLQASNEATARDVAELKKQTARMDEKLDRLLARTDKMRLTLKHWMLLLAGGSVGGGGIAHALRKLFE